MMLLERFGQRGCSDNRQRPSHPCRGRSAITSIAYQGHSSFGPGWHPDLTHFVEVEIPAVAQFLQPVACPPAFAAELLKDDASLVLRIAIIVGNIFFRVEAEND